MALTNEPSLKGVRGWLAVLVFVIGVLVPLGQVGTAVSLLDSEPPLEAYFTDNWPLYKGLTLALCGIRAIICLLVARVLIYEKTRKAPKLAIFGIWFALGGLGFASLAIAGSFGPISVDFGVMLQRMFWVLVICAIATFYLLKSKRVANTYTVD